MRLTNYWWLIIWPLIFGFFSRYINMQHPEWVDGMLVYRWKRLSAYILAAPFVVWAGWRKWFGDTEQYRATFQSLPSSFDQIASYMSTVKKGYGFRLLEVLFKCIVSNSSIAFFLVIAAIQIVCLVYVYRKYSPNFWLSFFFFVASTDYLAWMHNGIRQFLAAAILFLCVPLIARRKYIPAIIIILLVSQIHATALIFLPVIFIATGRAWNIRTLAFIAGLIIAVVFVDRITGFLTNALEDTAYSGDIVFLAKTNDNGTNLFRVLFYSVPAVMSWFLRRYLDRARYPLMNICANLSIISAGFYVFSYFTSGILMGAIPIYFSLSGYILIPWLLREVFSHKTVVMFETIFALVFIISFYYQCGPTWGIL